MHHLENWQVYAMMTIRGLVIGSPGRHQHSCVPVQAYKGTRLSTLRLEQFLFAQGDA